MDLAKKIIELSRLKGLKQEELAEKLGITRVTLSRTINGSPTLGTLQKIAEALGVPLSELFAERENGVIICPHCGKKILVEAKQVQSANDGAKQSE